MLSSKSSRITSCYKAGFLILFPKVTLSPVSRSLLREFKALMPGRILMEGSFGAPLFKRYLDFTSRGNLVSRIRSFHGGFRADRLFHTTHFKT